MPHQSLAGGRRETTGNYPGIWHVDDCEFKWFLPHEACDIVGSVGKIYFHGDSLIRHLSIGLAVVLSGNYRSGGLPRATPHAWLEACQCERQWQCLRYEDDGYWGADKMVNFNIITSPQFDLCPNWTRDHIRYSAFEDYLNSYGPSVVVSNGHVMHSWQNFDVPRKKMEGLLKQALQNNGTLIPMTMHYPGGNKPPQWEKTQGQKQIKALNGKMLSWAGRNNLWMLPLYEYTTGLWSRDGVHYDDENIIFAQLLLNILWRMQQEHGIIGIVPESNPDDPTTFNIRKPQDVGLKAWHTGKIPKPYKSLLQGDLDGTIKESPTAK